MLRQPCHSSIETPFPFPVRKERESRSGCRAFACRKLTCYQAPTRNHSPPRELREFVSDSPVPRPLVSGSCRGKRSSCHQVTSAVNRRRLVDRLDRLPEICFAHAPKQPSVCIRLIH